MKKNIFKVIGLVSICFVVFCNINISNEKVSIPNLFSVSAASAQTEDYSFYCCTGWGWACNKICVNVPGETEKFWGSM
jgi:hypothetical protein